MEKNTYSKSRGNMIDLVKRRNFRLFFLFFSFLFFSTALGAQNRTIEGKITDAKTGDAIIGAAISVKGTSIGTATNVQGQYSLSVPADATTLVISSMGYSGQEVPIGNQSVINVALAEDAKLLDEVVVVGFGTQKKIHVTGAVGVAKADELQDRPVPDLTQALQGLVPGLEISKNSGSMEKNATIRIRGVGTISGQTDASPLVLIDGIEGDMNTINPQDVESISVLKDAAAASIYGSRATYGVILITTKSGKSGKTTVNYNNNFRWSAPNIMPKMLDSYSFMNYFNDAQKNTSSSSAGTYIYPQETLDNVLLYRQGLIDGPYMWPTTGNDWSNLPAGLTVGNSAYGDTDWYDVMYKDWAFSQEHNVSASGGSEKVTFYTSLNYMDQSGLLEPAEEGMKRYSVNGKFTAKLAPWATLSYSSRFVRNDYSKPVEMGDGLYENLARQSRPNLSLYDNNGNMSSAFYYPKAFIEGGRYNKRADNNYQQMSLVLEPIKNWVTTGEINYRIYNESQYSYRLPIYNYNARGELIDNKPTTSVTEFSKREDYMNASLRSQYKITIDYAHTLSLMLGAQIEDLRQTESSVTAYGIINYSSPQIDATTGLDGEGNERAKTGSGKSASWGTAGFFGRFNYDYMNRYLLEVNLRYDGSSRYRAESRWRLYPSVALGWNIAEESFWDSARSVADLLKLRASWGSLGSQNTKGWYPTYLTMNLSPKNSSGAGYWLQNGERPASATQGNPITYDLTWETVTTWNIGLDWGMFRNRLTGSFDAYIRNTFDMVGPAETLLAVYGQEVPKPNNTSLQTRGFEFEIGWRDQLKNGFSYGAKFTLADAKTTITKYPNATNSLGEWWRNGVQYRTGLEYGEIWGYETLGIAKTEDDLNYFKTEQNPNGLVDQSKYGSTWGIGDIMYKDLNGNGRIDDGAGTLDDHGDIKVIGNSTPRYLFGLDLNAAWKGFDLRVFFQGVMKRDFWTNSFLFWGAYAGEAFSTGFVEHLDYFRADADHVFGQNLDAYYPRPSFDGSGVLGRNRQPQTRYLQDASYIRLKNLQLGYSLPQKWMDAVGFTQLRVYVSGENLWTGTKLMKMFDPETINGGKDGGDWRVKNNGNAYPISKVLSVGLSLTL